MINYLSMDLKRLFRSKSFYVSMLIIIIFLSIFAFASYYVEGMTEEFVQTRLFKPFQTTKASGMGIGTYESFQYVQELGGKLSVDSKVGKGTVVCLLLPLIEIFRDSELQPQEDA